MITINGKSYEAQIYGNEITLETDMTLEQAEKAFKPGMSAEVIVSDGDTELARYYNRGIVSLKVAGIAPRIVTVELDLTRIEEDAETEIRESIDTSDGAIAELAEMLNDLMERVEALERKEEEQPEEPKEEQPEEQPEEVVQDG